MIEIFINNNIIHLNRILIKRKNNYFLKRILINGNYLMKYFQSINPRIYLMIDY